MQQRANLVGFSIGMIILMRRSACHRAADVCCGAKVRGCSNRREWSGSRAGNYDRLRRLPTCFAMLVEAAHLTVRRLQREQEPKSPFVFSSERGAPFTTAGFARMIERAGKAAKLSFKTHPHMLRPRLWVRACQSGPRHEGVASLPGSHGHPAQPAPLCGDFLAFSDL